MGPGGIGNIKSFIRYALPDFQAKKEPEVTTLAVGEEAGSNKRPILGPPKPRTPICKPPGGLPRRRPPISSPFFEDGGKITTHAEGEEGGTRPPIATTMAVGEEGGDKPPQITTLALGEEAGDKPPVATTMAIGEEGGDKPPQITTLAVGEEGGDKPPVATTKAMGEEGGVKPPPVVTMAIGEDGSPPLPRPIHTLAHSGIEDGLKPPREPRYLGPPIRLSGATDGVDVDG